MFAVAELVQCVAGNLHTLQCATSAEKFAETVWRMFVHFANTLTAKSDIVALAAVAATSASFAQATISGVIGFGYVSDKVASVKSNGIETTDGEVTFAASEDLGGGLKASASMVAVLKGRTDATTKDAKIVVSGGFGTMILGQLEAGNGILGLGGAGAPGRGLDGVVIAAASNINLFKYVTPALAEGLTASFAYAEAGDYAGKGAAQVPVLGVSYSGGGLKVNADYSTFSYTAANKATSAVTGLYLGADGDVADKANATTTVQAPVTAATAAENLAKRKDNRIRLSASYDLGMATVGAGYEKMAYQGTGKDQTDVLVGVSAPLGPVTAGLNYAQHKTSGSSSKLSGWDMGVTYALSKRTSVNGSYMTAKSTGKAGDTYLRVKLTHSF